MAAVPEAAAPRRRVLRALVRAGLSGSARLVALRPERAAPARLEACRLGARLAAVLVVGLLRGTLSLLAEPAERAVFTVARMLLAPPERRMAELVALVRPRQRTTPTEVLAEAVEDRMRAEPVERAVLVASTPAAAEVAEHPTTGTTLAPEVPVGPG